jgi:hypothetical protein
VGSDPVRGLLLLRVNVVTNKNSPVVEEGEVTL